ncbi:MAG: sigma-70 family RNA polymerase sigma factor [Candidatus Eremiobacteraeota bacterium]|nr:sigma-70 family RNA polymerase sigma factor [Candidatus Eremiobacteraeota bacterium]
MHQPIEETLFESIFAREYRGVVNAARRIVGIAAAEDIAQDAFAAFYRLGPTDQAHARNWLYRTTMHRAISTVRTNKRRQARETSVDDPRAGSIEPSDYLERRELREEVRAVLRRIHARYAIVLALRHSGLSYKEIASIMDIKVNQVGTLLVRAEAAFKKELDRVTSR